MLITQMPITLGFEDSRMDHHALETCIMVTLCSHKSTCQVFGRNEGWCVLLTDDKRDYPDRYYGQSWYEVMSVPLEKFLEFRRRHLSISSWDEKKPHKIRICLESKHIHWNKESSRSDSSWHSHPNTPRFKALCRYESVGVWWKYVWLTEKHRALAGADMHLELRSESQPQGRRTHTDCAYWESRPHPIEVYIRINTIKKHQTSSGGNHIRHHHEWLSTALYSHKSYIKSITCLQVYLMC